MTTSTRPLPTTLPNIRTGNRIAPRSLATTEPTRREYRERDFGVGYGRSSGYGRTSYVRAWRPGVFTVR
jgi:hypothetical protein